MSANPYTIDPWMNTLYLLVGSLVSNDKNPKLSEIIQQLQVTVYSGREYWQENKDDRLDYYILMQPWKKG
jgi:hypothetical protein